MNKSKSSPEIRFKDFYDDWEQRKLGKELSLLKDGTHGTHKNVNDGPYLLSAKNIKNGKVNITIDDRKISSKEYELIHKNFKLKTNDILLTTVGSIGEAAILENPTGLTFQRSVAYLRTKDIDPQFLYRIITGPMFQKELLKRQVVSAQPGIYLGDLARIIFYTSKDFAEQKFIAKLFNEFDNTITLHQHELTLLKQRKKAFLQKMFPKKGEIAPELRFIGFNQGWKTNELGSLALFSKGKGYTKRDLVTTGSPIILYGRLYTNYETTIYSVDTYIDFIAEGSVISCGGEVIVPASGETSEDISRAAVISKAGIIIGGDLNIIKPYSEINSKFLAITISHGYQKKELSRRAQGKSVVHIRNSNLKNVKLFYPSFEEQKTIGNFFTQLDEDITLHEQKLKKLKEMKKAFLQKMFV